MLHDELIENWNQYAHTSKNAIFKALSKTYKKVFLYAVLINFSQV
jgi:hypothetical protein